MNAFFFHYSLCFIPSLQYLFTASCVLNCVLGTRGHKRNGYFISQLREEKSLPLLFFFFPLSFLQNNHKRTCQSHVCLLFAILPKRLACHFPRQERPGDLWPPAKAETRKMQEPIQKESGIKSYSAGPLFEGQLPNYIWNP